MAGKQVKRAAAKKAAAKKAAAKKAAAKTAPVKQAPARTAAKKQAPAAKAPARKASAGTAATTPRPAAPRVPTSMPYEQGKWAHVFTRAPGERRYWLVKSEPDVFAYADLERAPGRTTCWDNVRNTGARNFLRDGMKAGDLVFYYHSNADPSAIVGICEVVREGYPDAGAFDPANPYHDPASNPAAPTWFMVDVRAVRALPRPVTLAELKARPELADMALLRVGRLSVVPVTAAEWEVIVAMAETK